MTIYLDRGRRVSWEKCPRKRWYEFEYAGRGVSPVGSSRSDWPLFTGIGVHQGVGELAQGVDVEAAVQQALMASGYVSLLDTVDAKEAQGQLEQLALIEALVRCWAVSYLPIFNLDHEVLAVEREEEVELAPGVIMMVRPDMVVRRRSDGAIFTWQLKTAKRCDSKWCEQWPLDQMTISEVLAVEEGLRREFHKPNYEHRETVGEAEYVRRTTVSGVIVQGLVKGEQSEWPKGSGNWTFNNSLIYAWRNESGKPQPQGEWTARYAWSDEYGSHRLGKGWRKVAVWEAYPGGVAAWIEWLRVNDPAILEQHVVTLQPILRAPHEMERWKKGVVSSEQQIRNSREHLMNDHPKAHQGGSVIGCIDELFSMHTSSGNCVWPYKCSYFDVCWGGVDPSDDSKFKPRELNHKNEVIE